MVGYERGQACNVNLIKGWDFWKVAHESVPDLRTRYGIPTISGPILLPPPAAMDDAPDHLHSG